MFFLGFNVIFRDLMNIIRNLRILIGNQEGSLFSAFGQIADFCLFVLRQSGKSLSLLPSFCRRRCCFLLSVSGLRLSILLWAFVILSVIILCLFFIVLFLLFLFR